MTPNEILLPAVQAAVSELYGVAVEHFEFQATRRDFEGDVTLVVFPLLKQIKGNPAQIGNAIGEYLKNNVAQVKAFNVVQGFLNIVISDGFYLDFFAKVKDDARFGFVSASADGKAVMVEYSSPNTNKPLHLGHVRNNLLGYSVAEILKAAGNKVYKTQIINDRGIHICKSMLAWDKFGNAETPEMSGLKGDKLVGKYYVEFDKEYKKQIDALKSQGKSEDEAKKQAPILLEAQSMLRDWEAGKPEVMALWQKMNQWVYDGFGETYKRLGVDFDKYYYESNTYLLGKEVVQLGLEKGVFVKDPDGSVWIDLTEDGLDRKIVLRSDGTAVYMTQDIGTAIQRVKDFPDVGGMVYTVGNEQDYHFKVLFLILKKLGFDWADNLYHLSYGMVDLPSGKMKSREGTVVDADDLMDDMSETAQKISEELGKLDGYSDEEKKRLYTIIGLGALKYYILKVDPKKRILFNPEESVDFAGNTGPFIQYTYARIRSILRKADFDYSRPITTIDLHEKEKELLKLVSTFPSVIQEAAQNHSPALVANFTYDLVKEYNSFYQVVPILGAENENEKVFRTQLSKKVADTIEAGFGLLGIAVPERM
ncbi:arginine--tRNA ligase [Flavobacterium sp. MAH-1]|uniref:Arginine--tRNA ligase n=1 Tax=Flavobacterium agri TaxID=2743471 RepID=A0A7Y9C608_9FLAO|nr:arginine--tRNA ligase [Flavobacterium agri]NUY80960.1 arginine--tRNA ligase [Flavobacterium agri]NYA70984.1 arginine--tRNA ligase [Flavobacterium agri]